MSIIYFNTIPNQPSMSNLIIFDMDTAPKYTKKIIQKLKKHHNIILWNDKKCHTEIKNFSLGKSIIVIAKHSCIKNNMGSTTRGTIDSKNKLQQNIKDNNDSIILQIQKLSQPHTIITEGTSKSNRTTNFTSSDTTLNLNLYHNFKHQYGYFKEDKISPHNTVNIPVYRYRIFGVWSKYAIKNKWYNENDKLFIPLDLLPFLNQKHEEKSLTIHQKNALIYLKPKLYKNDFTSSNVNGSMNWICNGNCGGKNVGRNLIKMSYGPDIVITRDQNIDKSRKLDGIEFLKLQGFLDIDIHFTYLSDREQRIIAVNSPSFHILKNIIGSINKKFKIIIK